MSRKSRTNDYADNYQQQRFNEITALLPKNPSQVDALRYLQTKTLTILTGPPGTAKTLLATYTACQKLAKGQIKKVYYIKPVVNVVGETGLGFLPGDLSEKVAPHIAPLVDALTVFMQPGKAKYLLDKKIIEFLPIEHLRGRSLNDCMIIADEMQNATTASVMTILTRLGDRSSIALLGDAVQRDLAERFGKNGLCDAARRLGNHDMVGHVDFSFEEVERSPFVKHVIIAYADLY